MTIQDVIAELTAIRDRARDGQEFLERGSRMHDALGVRVAVLDDVLGMLDRVSPERAPRSAGGEVGTTDPGGGG